MGGPNIWEEQRNFVKNLHEQGILDSRFDEFLDLPRENPQFVIDLVTKFCSDAENSIAALIRYLNEPDINYPKVIDRTHQIKGASSCIGGHRMALASRELRYACEDKDKDRCFAAFCKTKDEYQILKEKFNIILQVMLRKKNYQPWQFSISSLEDFFSPRRNEVKMCSEGLHGTSIVHALKHKVGD